jgi:hypothetical protein
MLRPSGLFQRRKKECPNLIFSREKWLKKMSCSKGHSVNERGMDITHYFYKENQFCTILYSFGDGRFTEVKIQAACDGDVLRITKLKLYSLYDRLAFMKDIIDKAILQGLLEKCVCGIVPWAKKPLISINSLLNSSRILPCECL